MAEPWWRLSVESTEARDPSDVSARAERSPRRAWNGSGWATQTRLSHSPSAADFATARATGWHLRVRQVKTGKPSSLARELITRRATSPSLVGDAEGRELAHWCPRPERARCRSGH